MGRLAGLRYREIVRRLKSLGFQFDRHAAGSHEIWYRPSTSRYTTIPNHAETCRRGLSEQFSSRLESTPMNFYRSNFQHVGAKSGKKIRDQVPGVGCRGPGVGCEEKRFV